MIKHLTSKVNLNAAYLQVYRNKATDSVFQQALHQVLQPIFEVDFQQHSYGFCPPRNAGQAIE